MFLIDDVLLAPFNGLVWVFREVHKAAQQELAQESEAITAELRALHMRLEGGKITDAEFEARERELLDRLDKLSERHHPREDDAEV